jgi:anti-sigma regulatory factor (Ser/Thr protein kinase)
LKLTGAYRHDDLDRLCTEIVDLNGGGDKDVEIDLSDLAGLEPAALAILLSTFGSLGPAAMDTFVPPRNADGLGLLQPESLCELLDGRVGDWHRHDISGQIVGVEVFHDRDGAERALQEIAAQLEELDSLSPTWVPSMHALAYELCDNVLRHSQASGGTIVFDIDRRLQRVVLALADRGIGIRTSLTRNPELVIDSDLTAIRSAIGAQVTGEPARGAGMGLFRADRVVDDHGGRLLIRSGTGSLELAPQSREGTTRTHLPGTLVVVTLDTERLLDYGRVECGLAGPAGLASWTGD